MTREASPPRRRAPAGAPSRSALLRDHAAFERDFWGDCRNSYNEETKQLLYLREMGFQRKPDWRSPWWFDGEEKSYIDIGGGPASALLKFVNIARGMVVDPCSYPTWVRSRYDAAGIVWAQIAGEDMVPAINYDVALIYNCLQHVESPAQVLRQAISLVGASGLRMFEWINIPPHDGHPHMLTAAKLDEWSGRKGIVKRFNGENECYGTAWILGAP